MQCPSYVLAVGLLVAACTDERSPSPEPPPAPRQVEPATSSPQATSTAAPNKTLVETGSPAIQGGRILQESIGVETLGSVFTPLLEAGTLVPCQVTESFSTAEDNQDEILVTLYRGKAGRVADAHLLGRYAITGIPPQPRGSPYIEVEFSATDRDILLSARDRKSGRHLSVVPTSLPSPLAK